MARMLKMLLLLLTGLALVACATVEPAPDEEAEPATMDDSWHPDPMAEARYVELVELAQHSARDVDYAELRDVYVRTPYYQPYAGAEQQFSQAMFEALDDGRHQRALALASRILQENYVSLDAHYVARQVYAARGDQRRHQRHDYILRALFAAIRDSGSGESRRAAFQVISSREIQSFVALYGLNLIDSELEADEIGTHDRVTARDPDSNEEFELWFDISTQWRRGFDGF